MAANDVMREVAREIHEHAEKCKLVEGKSKRVLQLYKWAARIKSIECEIRESTLSRPDGGEVADLWIVKDGPACSDGCCGGCNLERYTRPAPPAVVDSEALRLLAVMFEAYENGTPCHELSGDEHGESLGNAFRLDDDDFTAIANLLNANTPAAAKGDL